MFATHAARWLKRHHIHYAWMMALLVFLTMLVASAAIGLPGAFIRPLSEEFGWNIDQISSALALRFALYGLMGPFAAILMERYELRTLICGALALIAAAMLTSLFMTQLWQLVMLWGLVLGLGAGLIALVLGAVVANRWFEKRRGLVLGMLTASTSTGQLAFLPLAAWLIEQYGWRVALIPIGIACLIVAGLVFCLACSHPEDVETTAYGSPRDGAAASTRQTARQATPPSFLEPLRTLRTVARNRTFWVLFGTFFICGLSTSGLIQTHFISLCGDYGLAELPAASVLAMMGVFDVVGTITSGWLSDRYDNRKLLFWYYGLRGLSLFWLPHSAFSLYGLSLFAVFYGLDWVATVPPTVNLTSAAFGRVRAGMVFGWIFTGHQIGGAIAAYGAGLTRTLLLTYTPALYAAGAVCMIAAAAVFMISRQKDSGGPPPTPVLKME